MTPLDRALIGLDLGDHEMVVERGRLRLFAKAIGETDPVYVDVDAARAAGHPDLPVPPTYFTCLDMMERPYAFEMMQQLGLDIRAILHAEQSFTYLGQAYAGDRLRFASRIRDIYAKKDGALEFAVCTTDVFRDADLLVRVESTMVVSHERR